MVEGEPVAVSLSLSTLTPYSPPTLEESLTQGSSTSIGGVVYRGIVRNSREYIPRL